jgi:peptidoglycan-associated lipoprotein
MSRGHALPLFALVLFACGGPEKLPEPKGPVSTTSAPPALSTPAPAANNGGLNVDDEIRKACGIVETMNVDKAPKFSFDSTELPPADRDVLAQVAKCLTTGPLKGQAVQLVGRADPRGEPEYNMGLGGRRAQTVKSYLTGLGVDSNKLPETSRGELDATGTDETGWAIDRRVDLKLVK